MPFTHFFYPCPRRNSLIQPFLPSSPLDDRPYFLCHARAHMQPYNILYNGHLYACLFWLSFDVSICCSILILRPCQSFSSNPSRGRFFLALSSSGRFACAPNWFGILIPRRFRARSVLSKYVFDTAFVFSSSYSCLCFRDALGSF